MDEKRLGLLIVGLGVVAVVVGLGLMAGAIGWLGRLPGDVRVEGRNVSFYFPIVSMLLLSLALTVVVNLARRI